MKLGSYNVWFDLDQINNKITGGVLLGNKRESLADCEAERKILATHTNLMHIATISVEAPDAVIQARRNPSPASSAKSDEQDRSG